MKIWASTFILSSVTALAHGVEDWKDRRTKERAPVDASSYSTVEEAYQAIVEHDKRRARMLKERLEHHERRLEEHTSGRMLLQDDEHERTLRQINVFSNHLDRLLSETYLEKMEKVHDARKSVYNMHRNDYLDYSKTGLN